MRRGQFVVDRHLALIVDGRSRQCLFVPFDRRFRNALLHETTSEPGVRLDHLSEWVPVLDGAAHFLQLANSFVEQAHFFERNAQVVMRVRIFGVSSARALLHVFFEFVEQIAQRGVSFRGLDRRWGRRRWCGNFSRESGSWSRRRSSGRSARRWWRGFFPGLAAERKIIT